MIPDQRNKKRSSEIDIIVHDPSKTGSGSLQPDTPTHKQNLFWFLMCLVPITPQILYCSGHSMDDAALALCRRLQIPTELWRVQSDRPDHEHWLSLH